MKRVVAFIRDLTPVFCTTDLTLGELYRTNRYLRLPLWWIVAPRVVVRVFGKGPWQ